MSEAASSKHARTFGLKGAPGGAWYEGTSAGPPPVGALPVAGPIRTFFGHALSGHGHLYSETTLHKLRIRFGEPYQHWSFF